LEIVLSAVAVNRPHTGGKGKIQFNSFIYRATISAVCNWMDLGHLAASFRRSSGVVRHSD
jgi:hypothetical protein